MKFKDLEKKINIKFKDQELLKKAFTHRSYINETTANIRSNERLEFLGDAVLQFLSSEFFFNKYSDFSEGELTNLRSNIVNTDSLAEEASRLKLYDHLYISKGEKEIATTSSYILANTFEALIGAIFLDQGINTTREFLNKHLLHKVEDIIKEGNLKDPKSYYQELAQDKFGVTPTYELIEESGPDHDKTFTIGLYLNDKFIAKGKGSSKRKAQQDAAKNALETIPN